MKALWKGKPMRFWRAVNEIIWLPDMDLNHDKQIQSLLCYRYTIGQTGASKVEFCAAESRSVAGFVAMRLQRQ
jgi:hypothetical protein